MCDKITRLCMMEGVYCSLKYRINFLKSLPTRRQFQRDIIEYVEIFYDRERLHSFFE